MTESLKEALRRLNRERLRRRSDRMVERSGEDRDYSRWVDRHDTHRNSQAPHGARLRRLQQGPLISVLMPVFNPEPRWLEAAIDSVCNQVYPHWELCIADDHSNDPGIRRLLEDRAAREPRIRVAFRAENGHISAASNTALDMARGSFVALLDHDDQLSPRALLLVAESVLANPGADLLYSDEDKLDGAGRRRDAYFKPDWNPELFRGHNMFSHLGIYRTEVCRRVGGFRVGFEGSQDYDLALRCVDAVGHDRVVHIPHVLYHWRLHEGSTSTGVHAKPYAMEAGRRALQEHLLRRNVNAQVIPDFRGWYCIDYALPQPAPRVVVVILDGSGSRNLRKCRALVEATEYPNFRIADPCDADAFGCNDSVAEAEDAEFIAFVDSRCRPHAPDWLRRLISHAVQPGVAAVGPKILDERGRVAGGAVVLGVGGSYGHLAGGIRADAEGYCGRAAIAQDVTALDEGCLVVRRSVFRHICGIHPTYSDLSVGTVDFTLRLGAYGYVNRWVPSARLSRKAEPTLRRWLKSRAARACRERLAAVWRIRQFNDPAHNPNLGLRTTHQAAYAHPPRVPAEQGAMID